MEDARPRDNEETNIVSTHRRAAASEAAGATMICPYCLDEGGILIQTDDGTRCGDCGRLIPPDEPKVVKDEAPTEEPLQDAAPESFDSPAAKCESVSFFQPQPSPSPAVSACTLPPPLPPGCCRRIAAPTPDFALRWSCLQRAFEPAAVFAVDQAADEPDEEECLTAQGSPDSSPPQYSAQSSPIRSMAASELPAAARSTPQPPSSPLPAAQATAEQLEEARQAGRAEMEGMVEELMANLEEAMKAKQAAEEAGGGGAEVRELTEQLQASMLACSKETMEKTKAQNANEELMKVTEVMEAEFKAENEVRITLPQCDPMPCSPPYCLLSVL